MTILYLYYNQPEAIRNLESLMLDTLPFETIIVDDGSNPKLECNWAKVLRIEEDIPWNISGAINFGLKHVPPGETVLRLDIDHWVDPLDLWTLSQYELGTKEILKFGRVVLSPKGNYNTATPPNIYLARAGEILEAGGYDERFAGNYGYEDKELFDRLHRMGFKTTIHPTIRTNVDINLSSKGLSRSTDINKALYSKIRSERQ